MKLMSISICYRPVPLAIGFIAQYLLKPALGLFMARAFGMSPLFFAGFVLMSCVAGAQLSSYASFLSKGDVALSILLTSSSTIASVLVTPVLTRLLIGSVVPVDAVAMSKSILQVSKCLIEQVVNNFAFFKLICILGTLSQNNLCAQSCWLDSIVITYSIILLVNFLLQVVLAPITLGLLINSYARPVVSILQPAMTFVAMICTSLCIGSPLAINRNQILSAEGLRLIGPVLSFHAAAFSLGYWIPKIQPFRQVFFQLHFLCGSNMSRQQFDHHCVVSISIYLFASHY